MMYNKKQVMRPYKPLTSRTALTLPNVLFSAYHGNHAAGANAVIDANHALVVGVLATAQEVLVA